MSLLKTLILSGYGLNCERETKYSCQQSGAQHVDIVHISRLLQDEIRLKDYHFLIFIGGFLDGDDLGAGRVGANRFRHSVLQNGSAYLKDELVSFIKQGKLILGICNGFQVMVKLGLLPATEYLLGVQEVSLTSNALGRFEDRWIHLKVNPQSKCIFTQGFDSLYLPIRHGEGRLEGDQIVLQQLVENDQVPLQYATPDGMVTETYPYNPNGSPHGIASLANQSGTVMGLMPHPEAFNHYTNHPHWTRLPYRQEEGDGLLLFKNAYRYLNA